MVTSISTMLSQETRVDIDDKYELYSSLPEWNWVHDILLKVDRECSPWMHAVQVQYLKKSLFIQIVERLPLEDQEETYISLEPQSNV